MHPYCAHVGPRVCRSFHCHLKPSIPMGEERRADQRGPTRAVLQGQSLPLLQRQSVFGPGICDRPLDLEWWQSSCPHELGKAGPPSIDLCEWKFWHRTWGVRHHHHYYFPHSYALMRPKRLTLMTHPVFSAVPTASKYGPSSTRTNTRPRIPERVVETGTPWSSR